MTSKMPVALWGVGRHAVRRILPALRQSKLASLVGVYSRNREAREQVAGEYSCRVYESEEAMLADPNVELVFLTTPSGLHATQGEQVVTAGKHAIIEKPLTHSLPSTEKLLDIADKNDRRVIPAFMQKYHPQFTRLVSLLEQDVVGDLRSLSIRFGIPSLNVNTFRDDPALGGGATLDMFCYHLSLTYQLLPTVPRLITGSVKTRAPSRTDSDGWCVLESGGVAVFCEWGMNRAYQNNLEVWGTEGMLKCDRVFSKEEDFDSKIELYDLRGSLTKVIETGRANAYTSMVDGIAEGLSHGDDFQEDKEEALWIASMIDQVLRGSG
ncbi:MAG: Gfo/Idh/MocA family oxidoreductase [Pseudomonadota bacterium]